MPPPAPKPSTPHISLPYRLYFLYLDPVLALSGTYLLLTSPQKFISSCTPSSTHPTAAQPLSALSSLLLAQTAALYLMHAAITTLVLRAVTPLHDRGYVRVWKSVMAAIALADVGHLWALYASSPAEFVDWRAWRAEDWTNYGVLSWGLVMRGLFLGGVGVRG